MHVRAAGINPGEINIRTGILHERFLATDATVPASQLIHKPANLSWEIAGSLYVVGCAAFAAVRAVEAKVGDTVAVAGVSGGVGSLVADGTIEFTIAATYPLERISDAFAQLEQCHTRGKIVLIP
ncbi:MAG TPA: zinc-binding dehydrogenase [Galbitalea sp.]